MDKIDLQPSRDRGKKALQVTYLAVLLVEVAFTWVDGVVHGCITENQLEVGAGGSERDLCVALPTAVLKSYLPFLDGSVSVTRVSHLQNGRKTNLFSSPICMRIYRLIVYRN